MARRPSPQTAAVLAALAREPEVWRYGYELGKEVGLEAGTLYPILMRLSDRGLLEAGWETDPPAGRPPRLWIVERRELGLHRSAPFARHQPDDQREHERHAGLSCARREGTAADASAAARSPAPVMRYR